MAQYKDKLISEHMNAPFRIGEVIKFNIKHIPGNYKKQDKYALYKITNIEGDIVHLKSCDYRESAIITNINNIEKNLTTIGHNPFEKNPVFDKMITHRYSIESILFNLGLTGSIDIKDNILFGHAIPECTDNPYVIGSNGIKVYYQRDYVWTIEDEQCFIESIYNNIDCGKIVTRARSFDYVSKKAEAGDIENLAFRDIVDGKQRIHTLVRFINDEFADSNGFYYSDLSAYAQKTFMNSMCISYTELTEDATDTDVINTFCMVNFAGKPMSKEHLEYLKSIC